MSYASEDRPAVQRLMTALQADGIPLWWDADIPLGTSYRRLLEQRLNDSSCVLVAWTRASVTSDWVLGEAAMGHERQVLVPVRLEEAPPPFPFNTLQTADLTHWTGDRRDPRYRVVLEAISGHLGRPVPPVATRSSLERIRKSARRAIPYLAAALAIIAVALGIASRPWTGIRIAQPSGITVVAVMEIEPEGTATREDCSLVRDALNASLDRFQSLRVISKHQITHAQQRDKSHGDLMATARAEGVEKMVTGHLHRTPEGVSLRMEITSSAGVQQASRTVRASDIDHVRAQAGRWLVSSLNPTVTLSELETIFSASAGQARLSDFELLTESMGFAEESSPPPPSPRSWWPSLVTSAHASEADEPAIHKLLEAYRVALETRRIEQVRPLYVEFTDRMSGALEAYFATAEGLSVAFSNVTINVETGDEEALATFTRTDSFHDPKTTRDVRLDIRVSSIVVKRDGAWKIKGLKKDS